MDNKNTKVICITPVKNEEWIIERFLKCTSLWADHIIIADQDSTDQTREIAEKFEKVILIENPEKEYSEINRSILLWDEVRKIQGDKLVVALDADEFFSSDFHTSNEWKTMVESKEDTLFILERIDLLPDFSVLLKTKMCIAYKYSENADMSQTAMVKFHNMRVPWPQKNDFIVHLNKIKVLHYNYLDYERVCSRSRWYQCFEKLMNKRNGIDIFRVYYLPLRVEDVSKHYQLQAFQHEWIAYYEAQGIDMTSINCRRSYWWDIEVINHIREHGKKFKYLNLWQIDWDKMGRNLRIPNSEGLNIRRGIFVKIVFRYLVWSQPYRSKKIIIFTDRLLKTFAG